MIQVVVFFLGSYFALILLTSGLSKLAGPDYALLYAIKLPKEIMPLGQVLYHALAWTEIGVSVLLATNSIIHIAMIINIVLFLIFLMVQVTTLSIAKETNCGCFGNIYKIKSDKIHLSVTAVQSLIAVIYYWLTITHREISVIQTIGSTLVYSGLCIWILARRLSLLESKKVPAA